MKKTQNNLTILTVIFVVALVTSNIVTGKLITTPFALFGVSMTLPAAIPCYAITFLMTDIIGEIWGKKEANRAVIYGLIGQVTCTALIIITRYFPAADPAVQDAYVTILGQQWVFLIGSLIGYWVSQHWDVYIFHKIRDKYLKTGSTRARWIWNNASTMTSQIWDTVLFIGIAFGLGYGWLFNSEMRMTLLVMMIGQYCVKFILACIDTPFFYFFTRRGREINGETAQGDRPENI